MGLVHAAVSRRPPISLHTIEARAGGYTPGTKAWDLSLVHGPFLVASCQTLVNSSIRNLRIVRWERGRSEWACGGAEESDESWWVAHDTGAFFDDDTALHPSTPYVAPPERALGKRRWQEATIEVEVYCAVVVIMLLVDAKQAAAAQVSVSNLFNFKEALRETSTGRLLKQTESPLTGRTP